MRHARSTTGLSSTSRQVGTALTRCREGGVADRGDVHGADGIDDTTLARHGGIGTAIGGAHVPSALGSLRLAFTLGHVRQLHALAPRFLAVLAWDSAVLGARGDNETVMVFLDDTDPHAHGHCNRRAGRSRPAGGTSFSPPPPPGPSYRSCSPKVCAEAAARLRGGPT